jgi:Ran-binding protein 3
MRKEGVHSLVMNALLFPGMKFEVAQDPRYVRFATPNENKTFTQCNIRVSAGSH